MECVIEGPRLGARGSKWGWSSNYKLYRGLKVHAVVGVDGSVRDMEVTAANRRETDVFFRGTGLRVLLADKGYDSMRLMDRYEADGLTLPMAKARGFSGKSV